MFVTIRKYANCLDPEAVRRTAEEKFRPLLHKVPGFRSYAVINADRHSIFSISVFETEVAAEQANALARELVQRLLPDLLPNRPVVTMAEIDDDETVGPAFRWPPAAAFHDKQAFCR